MVREGDRDVAQLSVAGWRFANDTSDGMCWPAGKCTLEFDNPKLARVAISLPHPGACPDAKRVRDCACPVVTPPPRPEAGLTYAIPEAVALHPTDARGIFYGIWACDDRRESCTEVCDILSKAGIAELAPLDLAKANLADFPDITPDFRLPRGAVKSPILVEGSCCFGAMAAARFQSGRDLRSVGRHM